MNQPPAPSAKQPWPRALGIAFVVLIAIAAALLRSPEPSAQPTPSAQLTPSSQPTAVSRPPPATSGQRPAPASSTSDRIAVSDGAAIGDPVEVREIRRTLAVMRRGPPYPFRADNEVWENREHRLPEHRIGWYHAFTVITPDDDDRGTRRIVGGEDGALWFTRDHYHHFMRLDVPDPRAALRN